ncbi:MULTISPECIES: O-antigen ligase family protein [Methylosinus]|uniref:O-antigen ligase domain-containing protein n=1 Tax=Methylosinus trichosporium (strain ATCC 35070 / NCIMB 11131 / UNIQEM 75 / OB3b) TaxID=595536 RepID=A0A2D2D3Y1_METT3|nr:MULTISPECIES: O-antigen ligase family protein [Methylosinus]ATQ69559.1 O-antigen ligase domain-containing protein [Methylosinus trichosporium OB3b]OBS50478.1 hypothetical protein A8B73_21195 [Methylosinus sp. 3S-1]
MRPIEILSGVAIGAALLMGGATQKGSVSDDFVQLCCLPLLALALHGYLTARVRCGWPLIATLVILATPMLQLIALPPALWMALPGRAAVADTFHSADLTPPWLGVTISQWATTRAVFALLPPVAIFLGVRACAEQERRRLAWIIVAIGLANVFLEVVQIVQGPDSAFRFYAVTNREVGVGFFANRNHAAAFLYSSLLMLVVALPRSAAGGRGYRIAISLGFALTVWLGLMMTGSRSALLIGAVSTVALFALGIWGGIPQLAGARATAGLVGGAFVAVSGALLTAFGLSGILGRFGEDAIISDARWPVARISLRAAEAFFPFGSGLGTFERVYPLFVETSAILPATVNHAHNDLIEIVVETGAAGVMLILGAAVLIVSCGRRGFRERNVEGARVRLAALLVVMMLLAHSLWDYPLRASANAAVFAYCCAILFAVARPDDRGAAELARGGKAEAPRRPWRRPTDPTEGQGPRDVTRSDGVRRRRRITKSGSADGSRVLSEDR